LLYNSEHQYRKSIKSDHIHTEIVSETVEWLGFIDNNSQWSNDIINYEI